MAHQYVTYRIKNNLMDSGAKEATYSIPSMCSSSKNSSIGDFDDLDSSYAATPQSPGCLMQGRSVKDFEDQLTNLKKENFNLKLRIYFLEEKLGLNFTLDQENIVKKNIELQVEVANLQKEIKEKHELLCQAVKAMELEEEEHKTLSRSKEGQIYKLQQELHDLTLHVTTEGENNTSLQHVIDPTEYFKTRCEILQKESEEKDVKIHKLSEDIISADKRQLEYSEQIKEYKRKLLIFNKENVKLTTKIEMYEKQIGELHSQITDITKKLTVTCYELDKERKRSERNKTINDIHTTELENQNDSYKLTIQDLQNKLDGAHAEANENHNLAVSKSPMLPLVQTNFDNHFILAPNSTSPNATSHATSQKDALHIQMISDELSQLTSSVLSTNYKSTVNDQDGTSPETCECADNKECTVLKQKIVDLKGKQIKACEIIKRMIETRKKLDEEILYLKKKNSELELELESVVSKSVADNGDVTAASNCNSAMKAMAENKVLSQTLHERNIQMHYVYHKYDDRIIDLEFGLFSNNEIEMDQSLFEMNFTKLEEQLCFYKLAIEKKNNEIEILNYNLKRYTHFLQEIVNKELWEKNKEIEKMHQKREGTQEFLKLRKQLYRKEEQLNIFKEKITKLGLNITIPLEANDELPKNVETSKSDNKLYTEINKYEKLKIKTNEICSKICSRLEQLAALLNSLLNQKSVVSYLGSAKSKKIRNIISKSLDLSRSFHMNLFVNPDYSVLFLSNIIDLLNYSEFQDLYNDTDNTFALKEDGSRLSVISSNITLTYPSHLLQNGGVNYQPDNEEVIAGLKQIIITLRNEIKLRDEDLERFLKENRLKQSQNTVTKCESQELMFLENHTRSKSEGWSEAGGIKSRDIVTTTDAPKESFKLYLNKSVEEDSPMDYIVLSSTKKYPVIELNSEILELKNEVSRKSLALNQFESISNSEGIFADDEIAKKHIEVPCKALQEIGNEPSIRKQHDVSSIIVFKDNTPDRKNLNNKLDLQKTQNLKLIIDFKKKVIESRSQVTILEKKVESIFERMKLAEIKIRTEYEIATNNKLNHSESEFIVRLKTVKEKLDLEIKVIIEYYKSILIDYQNNYVKRCELKQKIVEIDTLVTQLNDLKALVKEYEVTIELYNIKKQETDHDLRKYHNQISNLRKELDVLKEELKKCNIKEIELTHINKLQSEYLKTYEEQISILQKEKASLDIKVSELETVNAEIQNRLINQQVHRQHDISVSVPNSENHQHIWAILKHQLPVQCPISSQENVVKLKGLCHTRSHTSESVAVNPDHRVNDSKLNDVGIESGCGRFSGVGMPAPMRTPIIHTIELAESMSNLLEEDNLLIINANDQCCKKSIEIKQENHELKRKLLGMKGALEDTANQLNLANQRKMKVEKNICKQIYKTSQVLRKAKANLDLESENDVAKRQKRRKFLDI